MLCTLNSVTQSKRVFRPNHSIFSTAGYRRIKDAKNVLGAEKMTFFGFFFIASRRNFFVFTKISYLQPFREIMGGPEKALQQRRWRRTTWTIITPRQDSFRILGLISNWYSVNFLTKGRLTGENPKLLLYSHNCKLVEWQLNEDLEARRWQSKNSMQETRQNSGNKT